MAGGKQQRRPIASWIFIAVLFLLCGALGALQYRWIGELSVAARERLRAALDTNLVRLSSDFNTEVESGLRPLLPTGPIDGDTAERTIASRYDQWKRAGHGQAIRRLAIAIPANGKTRLRMFDWERGQF
jgi:hypothetical protein